MPRRTFGNLGRCCFNCSMLTGRRPYYEDTYNTDPLLNPNEKYGCSLRSDQFFNRTESLVRVCDQWLLVCDDDLPLPPPDDGVYVGHPYRERVYILSGGMFESNRRRH